MIPFPFKEGIIVIASVILTIAVSDLLLRAIGYLPQVDNEWQLGPNYNSRVPDAGVILVRPRFRSENHYKIDATRGTVIVLGDSFTEGHPVSEADNYPAVLGQLLEKRGRVMNIINLGLGDSGPDQQLRVLKEYLLPRLTPDTVVWSFYSNDVLDNLRQAVYSIEDGTLVPLDATKHWLYIRQKLYGMIPLPYTVKERSPVLRLLFRALEVWGNREINVGNPSEQARSLAKINLAIEEMERLAEELDFRVIYVLIAPQVRYFNKYDFANEALNSHMKQYRQLRPILARQNRFADAWFGDATTLACGSTFDVPGAPGPAVSSIFADGTQDKNELGRRHFNETGYHVLAELVATCLMSER